MDRSRLRLSLEPCLRWRRQAWATTIAPLPLLYGKLSGICGPLFGFWRLAKTKASRDRGVVQSPLFQKILCSQGACVVPPRQALLRYLTGHERLRLLVLPGFSLLCWAAASGPHCSLAAPAPYSGECAQKLGKYPERHPAGSRGSTSRALLRRGHRPRRISSWCS